MYIQQLSRIC